MKQLLIILAVVLLASSAMAVDGVFGVYYGSNDGWGTQYGTAIGLGNGFYTIPKIGHALTDEMTSVNPDVAWVLSLGKLWGGVIFTPVSAEFYENPDITYITSASGLVAGYDIGRGFDIGLTGTYKRAYDDDAKIGSDWSVAGFMTFNID